MNQEEIMKKRLLIKSEKAQSKSAFSTKQPQNEFFYLKTIIKTLPGSIYWKNMEGVYLGCNDFMLEMAGLDDVVGKTDFDLPWKKEASQIRKNDLNTIKSNAVLELEECPTLANGKKIIMLTRKAPLKDEQGNIIGVFGISLDITKSKKLEAALKELKDQTHAANVILQQAKEQAELTLNNIVANMPGHVYWKDKNGVYLGCNNRQAESLGLRYGSDVIGKTDFDLPWAKNVASTFRENDARIMETGQAEIIEENAQIYGKKAIVLSQKTPLRNKQGDIIGILGISIDITDRKQFETDLKEAKEKAEVASKAKTEFLENMRHDIRTPLIGIMGFANIIGDEVKDPKIKEYVDNLNASSNALLELLNEILDIIKLNSGEIPILKKKFDLRKRLDDVIKLNQAKAHHKNIDLIFNYDENIPSYLVGDSTRIHRIVLELIANGLNFTDHGLVRLKIQLAKSEGQHIVIKIIVEDTGIGIESEKQQEIFLQFKRLTPSYQGIYKGTGLGLAIVKQFIDELQGEIYVESKVGTGTKFTCVIPLKKSLLDEEFGSEDVIIPSGLRKTIPQHMETMSNEKKSSIKSHILIVEDNLIAATVVNNILSGLDCRVDMAGDGKKAVQLVQENTYDLIFMDIGLPEIDGYEASRRIRLQALQKGTHVPIIALTAHVDEESKQRCLEVGMNAVLTKPLAKEKAEDILNAFIPFRKQRQEKQIIIESEKEIDLLKIEGKVVDFEWARKQLGGNEDILNSLLNMLIEGFPTELKQLEAAYKDEDWPAIQAIAHKLKGGSSYIGTVRLKKTCSLLELAIKKDEKKISNTLYKQMLIEIAAIEKEVKN